MQDSWGGRSSSGTRPCTSSRTLPRSWTASVPVGRNGALSRPGALRRLAVHGARAGVTVAAAFALLTSRWQLELPPTGSCFLRRHKREMGTLQGKRLGLLWLLWLLWLSLFCCCFVVGVVSDADWGSPRENPHAAEINRHSTGSPPTLTAVSARGLKKPGLNSEEESGKWRKNVPKPLHQTLHDVIRAAR